MRSSAIEIRLLEPHPANRLLYGETVVSDELLQSISKNGFLQRVIVVQRGSRYTIVSGHARVAAARQLGMDVVFCDIMDEDVSPNRVIELMVDHNRYRERTTEMRAREAAMLLDLGSGPGAKAKPGEKKRKSEKGRREDRVSAVGYCIGG